MNIHIPASLAKDELRIKRFFDAMIHKLAKNSHKKSFAGADLAHCLERISEETEELRTSIEEGNSIEIALEAADVANFALLASVAAIERCGPKTGDMS